MGTYQLLPQSMCTKRCRCQSDVVIVSTSILSPAVQQLIVLKDPPSLVPACSLRPHRFMARPEFLLVCSVYCVTYGTANTMNTMSTLKAKAQKERVRTAQGKGGLVNAS